MDTCARCHHDGYFHRLDDSKNIGPCEPGAKFRCIWPTLSKSGLAWSEGEPCTCPDFEEPTHA